MQDYQFDDGLLGVLPGIRRRGGGPMVATGNGAALAGTVLPDWISQGPISGDPEAPSQPMIVDQGNARGPGQPPPGALPGHEYPEGSGVGPAEGSVGNRGADTPAQLLDTPRQIQMPPSGPGPGPAPGGQATPTLSQTPNPAAAGTPSPEQPPTFQPMQSAMSPSDISVPGGGSDNGIMRRSISPYSAGTPTGGPSGGANSLLGRAGGLLGGGLGIPGMMGTQDQTDIGDLIAQLYMLANRR